MKVAELRTFHWMLHDFWAGYGSGHNESDRLLIPATLDMLTVMSSCYLQAVSVQVVSVHFVFMHFFINPSRLYPWCSNPEWCVCDVVLFQMLGGLAVDTVYPVAGLLRMGEGGVRRYQETMRELSEGKSSRKVYGGELTAGSRAEGVAMERGWAHGEADEDTMLLCGGDLVVYVLPLGQQPPEDATLVFTPQQCPPAYCRLQVLHKDRALRAIIKRSGRPNLTASAPEVQQCVFSEGDQLWLHSRHTLEVMTLAGTQAISGPAGQDAGGRYEFIHSLVCSGPHPAMASYKKRARKDWPSTALLDALIKQPMLLVMVGPKDCQDPHLMFRNSWSTLELLLMSSLAPWLKQGYVCFKYTVKSALKSLRPKDSEGDGRSRVGSYHLKTVFFRHLEEHPPQQEGSPFQLMLDLCQDLQHYLLMGCLPHYFLPECDLLKTAEYEERQYALQAVGQVIADPLVPILRSPSEPEVIYCDQSPDDLIRCFNDVSSLPSCLKRHWRLQWLLHRLDDHREALYLQQLEKDWDWRVFGRPRLVRLADYLKLKKFKTWLVCYCLNDIYHKVHTYLFSDTTAVFLGLQCALDISRSFLFI